jgi:hypothetical protein
MITNIPPITKSTVMSTAIRMGVITITSIIMSVNTITNIIMRADTIMNIIMAKDMMLSHIITIISTQNITGITGMSTPATKRSFRPIRDN